MPYFPTSAAYDPYFQQYINLSPSNELIEALKLSGEYCKSVFLLCDDHESNRRYLAGKWTIKQVLQHVLDAEQILAYRALRIGRGDTTELSGFDQDLLMQDIAVDRLHYKELIERFVAMRASNISLFSTFTEQQLAIVGKADGKPISAGALGFIIAGHGVHHANVIKQRYFKIF
jgi:hypothetical protein